MDEQAPALSVCLPAVRGGVVGAAIRSVQRQSVEDWELIVVMQGDDPELVAEVDRFAQADQRVHAVWLPEKGVSRARNCAAEHARASTFAFLDDDCEASTDWLEVMLGAMEDDPSVGLVAGALVAPPDLKQGWIQRCPTSLPGDFTHRPVSDGADLPDGARFVTASCAVRRWAWERVGPFDELLGAGATFGGGEDLDFLVRTIHAGIPVRFEPRAVATHTFGTRRGVRSVLRSVRSYGTGQGVVAAKLDLSGRSSSAWRSAMRQECLLSPLRSLRPDRAVARLPRWWAFERAYRRCVRGWRVDPNCVLQQR